jgi:hypothetical protein
MLAVAERLPLAPRGMELLEEQGKKGRRWLFRRIQMIIKLAQSL